MKINWIRVVCNSGIAFFTTASSILTADAMLESTIPLSNLVLIALISSFIYAGLAFFTELKHETNSDKTMYLLI